MKQHRDRRLGLRAGFAALLLAVGASSLLVGGMLSTAWAAPDNDQVCAGLDSGKIDTPNSPSSITVTAPEGKLIDGYCVKAGSANQGDGPVFVAVDPPAKSVTITHPSGKQISHYSVSYVDEGSTPTPTETVTETPTETPTETETPTPTETVTTTPTETIPPPPTFTDVPTDTVTVLPTESIPPTDAPTNPTNLPTEIDAGLSASSNSSSSTAWLLITGGVMALAAAGLLAQSGRQRGVHQM